MQERGLAAYFAELIGTFLLVFFITSVVVLFVATGNQAQFGSDFAVVGLAQAFALFGIIVMFGVVSGGHFNPAVTLAVAALKRISPIDAAIYMPRPALGRGAWSAPDQGPVGKRGSRHPLRSSAGNRPSERQLRRLGGRGGRHLLLGVGVLSSVYSKKNIKDWAPLVIGTTLAFIVMVGGPLDGGSFNPARWFGPALVGNSWGGVWPYLVGPIVGSLLAAAVFPFVLEPGGLPPTDSPDRLETVGEKTATADSQSQSPSQATELGALLSRRAQPARRLR